MRNVYAAHSRPEFHRLSDPRWLSAMAQARWLDAFCMRARTRDNSRATRLWPSRLILTAIRWDSIYIAKERACDLPSSSPNLIPCRGKCYPCVRYKVLPMVSSRSPLQKESVYELRL